MATVTYHIYSHNNDDSKRAEAQDLGCEEGTATIDDEWQQAAPRSNRHAAPQFVPAIVSYDEWCSGTTLSENSERDSSRASLGASVSGWYRSLTSSDATPDPSSSASSCSHSHSRCQPTSKATYKARAMLDKNNWFIKNAIRSESSPSLIPKPSLAEILARDPPPLPSEQKYTPPVWLEIGPSNKGFEMLQRAGWSEGEALGPDVVRRKPVETLYLGGELFHAMDSKGKAKASQSSLPSPILRQEMLEIKVENVDDIIELRPIEVIDLSLESDEDAAQSEEDAAQSGEDAAQSDEDATQSDSISEDGTNNREEAVPPGDPSASDCNDHMQGLADKAGYKRKALLTPIATVLKSDRLGIGLKAKTVGPHKASQKRVTHNAAALAAHIQAAEESRKRRQQFGRGWRGLERQHRQEEHRRKAMMAYFNSS